MKTIGQSIHDVFAARDWTQEERDSIEDVLDAAAAFVSFQLPLGEAARAGVMAAREGFAGGASFARVRAVLAASPDDPRRDALMDMLDIMIRSQAGVQTNHGWFSHADIAANGFVIKNRPRAQAA